MQATKDQTHTRLRRPGALFSVHRTIEVYENPKSATPRGVDRPISRKVFLVRRHPCETGSVFVLTCCRGVSKEKCLFKDSSSSSVTTGPSPLPTAIFLDDLASLLPSDGARIDRRAAALPCSIAANLDWLSPPSHPAPRPPPPSPHPPIPNPPSAVGVDFKTFSQYPPLGDVFCIEFLQTIVPQTTWRRGGEDFAQFVSPSKVGATSKFTEEEGSDVGVGFTRGLLVMQRAV